MVGSKIYQRSCFLWTSPTVKTLEEAILYTLFYADIFNYPLTLNELHRYMVGFKASPEVISAKLAEVNGITEKQGYYMLEGRESILSLRIQREGTAAGMWPRALNYGKAIAKLPFVRMVALTGSLAVCNVDSDADFDYFVVTAHGRVWLARLLMVQNVVKPAARRGDEVCPNYILTENALELPSRNLYHAHELAQMIPLYGLNVYKRLLQANQWFEKFLPNAVASPMPLVPVSGGHSRKRRIAELALSNTIGSWLESREMLRLGKKLNAQGGQGEVQLSPECCKGHVDSHGHRTFEAFAEKMQKALKQEP